MSLNNFGTLKTSIATWAMRSGDADFTAAVPDFVALCEDMINNGAEGIPALRTREMETSAPLTLTAGLGTLPADFLEYREVRNALGNTVTPIVASYATDAYYGQGSGIGYSFALPGGSIQTYRADAGPLTLIYYKRVPALVADGDTNWLLTKAPRVYLFGSLLQSAPFMMDDERIATWGALYQKSITGLINSDFRSKYTRATTHVGGPVF